MPPSSGKRSRNADWDSEEDDDDSKRQKHENDDVEHVFEIGSGKVKGSRRTEEKKPLVIPLIEKNQWKTEDLSNTMGYGLQMPTKRDPMIKDEPMEDVKQVKEEKPLTMDEQAMQLLLQEAKNERPISNQVIEPLLQINAIPGMESLNEDAKFKLDVDLRPQEASLEDYEDVPIDVFGAALLRGMGWKEGESVGRNKKNALSRAIEFIPRPEFLGLGAEPTPPPPTRENKDGRKWIMKPGEEKQKPRDYQPVDTEDGKRRHYREIGGTSPQVLKSGIKKGSKVRVIHGRLEGKKGKVVEVQFRQGKDARIHVQLSDRKGEDVFYEDELKIVVEEEETISSSKVKNWLTPNIRVRIISKSLHDGSLYKTKASILDVTMPGVCIIKTSDGKIIEEVAEHWLETVVPSIGDKVKVVGRGNKEAFSHLGKIVDKDRNRGRVVVELEPDQELVTLDFDDVCETT